MKRTVEKKQKGKIVIRPHADDAAAMCHGLAAKLTASEAQVLAQRERDLVLIAIACRRMGIVI